MNILRTITVTKWNLADNSTGLEYTVRYAPSTGVDEIISVHAVEKASTTRIDLTMTMVNDYDLDRKIDQLLRDELNEAYYEQRKPFTPLFNIAAAMMRNTAKHY